MRAYLIDVIRSNEVMSVSKIRQYLWKDELNDIFLITKNAEIYLFTGYTTKTFRKPILGCYCWKKSTYILLKKRCIIFEERLTDDRIYFFKTEMRNLPLLLSLGAFKRRPDRKGRWIHSLENKLGHKIMPYEPILSELADNMSLTLRQDISKKVNNEKRSSHSPKARRIHFISS